MKYFFTIFTLFTVSSVFSQEIHRDSSANYFANWVKGENKIYYIIHNKESYELGKLKSEFNFSYETHITVLDSTKDSYTIQWTFHLPDKIKETKPKLADSLPVFEGMKMIFKTSETGIFKELINWQEVKDTYIKMMEFSLPQKMDSTTKSALEQAKALFNSKEMVESALIKEIQLFYLPYGQTFTTNEKKEKTQLPSPFGSDSVPALKTYQITELNPNQNYFMLTVNQYIDKSGAQKFFEGLFSKANMDSDKAVLEAKKFLKAFEFKDHREYKFISSIGWPKRISYERTLKNEQITQTDSYIIEMK